MHCKLNPSFFDGTVEGEAPLLLLVDSFCEAVFLSLDLK